MIATQLPDRHPEPTDQQIPHYPSGNLCRCGAILKSSRRQSSPHRSAKPVPRWPETSHEQSSVLRVAHICGRACELAGRSASAIAGAGLADTAARARHRSADGRQRHRHRGTAGVRAGLQADRANGRDRELPGRLADDRRGRGRQGRPRRLHRPGRGIGARGDPLDHRKPPVQRADRSDRGRRACERAAGDGGAAGEGI